MKPIQQKPDKQDQRHNQQSLAEVKLGLREYLDSLAEKLDKETHARVERWFKDYKEGIDRKVKRPWLVFVVILGLLGLTSFSGIYQTYRWGVAQIQKQISSRLDNEFRTERIRDLIDEKAKLYVETEAQKYISKRVEETIAPFQKEIKGIVESANKDLENVNQFLQIYQLSDRARIDSKSAYLELVALATGQSTYASVAKNHLIEIQKHLQLYRDTPSFYQELMAITDQGQIPYEKLPLDEIVRRMHNPTMPDNYRHTCMVYIRDKPKKEIYQVALTVFRTSNSLPICAAVCGVLSEISEQKAGFLDFDGWSKICEEELRKHSSR